MAQWEDYEAEWVQSPTVDDLAAAYMQYKPPIKPGEIAKDSNVMGPADFARWLKATGGSKIAPGAS